MLALDYGQFQAGTELERRGASRSKGLAPCGPNQRPALPKIPTESPMLCAEQRALIKATVPLLESGGEALTTHFYRLMLAEHPEVRPL